MSVPKKGLIKINYSWCICILLGLKSYHRDLERNLEKSKNSTTLYTDTGKGMLLDE